MLSDQRSDRIRAPNVSGARRTPGRNRNGSGTRESPEQAILAATEHLLVGTPLRDLSVAEILRHAGVSRTTFYFYFDSKFDVLVALVHQVIDEIYETSRMTPLTDSEHAASEALARRLRASLEVWWGHRPVIQATVENLHAYPELQSLWLEMLGGLRDRIAAEIERQRRNGRGQPRVDAQALAATLAWTTERCLYVAALELPEAWADAEGLLSALTQIWVGVMLGKARAASPSAG